MQTAVKSGKMPICVESEKKGQKTPPTITRYTRSKT